MTLSLRALIVSVLAAIGWSCAGSRVEPLEPLTQYPIGLEELYRLDLLPRFKHSERVGMFSSYDRSGGNDDGFNGTYSFIRKEEDGSLVLAELEGPGALYRIWTPTPTGDWLEFFFDGESEPRIRIRFRDLFTGEQAPFEAPLVGFGVGGFYSYLPILFEKSIKVVARTEQIRFYQINYALYPPETPIRTYDGYGSPEDQARLEQAKAAFGAVGADLTSRTVPPGDTARKTKISAEIAPGETRTLWQSDRGGRIAGFKLGPASALARKDRALVLRMFWDGTEDPGVLSPAGDFFGYSFGEPAAQSMLVGTRNDAGYVYFPMPYDRSARIEISYEGVAGDGPAIRLEGEVLYSPTPRAPDEGRFHAHWRRENPTAEGEPYTFLDVSGRGHVVGAILQAQGLQPANTGFFEGDDRVWIDGELAAHGTGSEDFFNGGWYNVIGRWMSHASFPLSGCLEYKNPLSRTGGYRLLLTDSYPYRKSLRLTMEHGPEGNRAATDYASTVYWYSEHPPSAPLRLPALAGRAVQAPEKVVFRPGWSVPVDSFSFQNMTIAKRTGHVGGQPVRFLRIRAEGEDRFGPHSVSFRFELPEAGLYRISMEAVKGPGQAVVRIFRQEKAEGQAVDLYAPGRTMSGPVNLAELPMTEGENVLMFKLTGKNPDSSGLGFDLASVVFERVTNLAAK